MTYSLLHRAARGPVSDAATAIAAEHNRQRRKRTDKATFLAFNADGTLHTAYPTAPRGFPNGTLVTRIDAGPLTAAEAQALLEQDCLA